MKKFDIFRIAKSGHFIPDLKLTRIALTQQEQIIKHVGDDLDILIKFTQKFFQNKQDLPLLRSYIDSQIIKDNDKKAQLNYLKLCDKVDLLILLSLPNSVQNPVIYFVLNRIIKEQMSQYSYQEATQVLIWLKSNQILKQLVLTQWVQNLIRIASEGLEVMDIKNISILSSVLGHISDKILSDLANKLKKLLKTTKGDQLSLITLYQRLSKLQNQDDLLKTIASRITFSPLLKDRDLAQISIGSIHCNDLETATKCFTQQKSRKIQQSEINIFNLLGAKFSLFSLEEGNKIDLKQIYQYFNTDRLGLFCYYMYKNYQIDYLDFFKQNTALIDEKNIVFMSQIFQNQHSELGIEQKILQYMQQNKIQMAGIITLMTLMDLQRPINQYINNLKQSDIVNQVKEVAALILHVQNICNVQKIIEIYKWCVELVQKDLSRPNGLGNIIYVISKQAQISIDSQLMDLIFTECDQLELNNFQKALLNLGITQ
ncbi:hypothetical protein pb186bvf_019900 [Paramecium bursaria]